jgi:hypothetical protein
MERCTSKRQHSPRPCPPAPPHLCEEACCQACCHNAWVNGHCTVMPISAGVMPVKASLVLCCHHGVAQLGQGIAGEGAVGLQGLL